MRGIIRILGATAIVVALASPTHAITDAAKCEKKKAVAAGKAYATGLKCRTKFYADPSFDVIGCIDAAKQKCNKAFEKADEKFGFECLVPDNGQDVCDFADIQAGSAYILL